MKTDTAERPLRPAAMRRRHEQLDYENYLRFEEMTDISERLSLPVETTIDFKLDEDGYVYSSLGDRFVTVIENGYKAAQAEAAIHPENAFQAERARLETEEMLMVEQLARGELDGNGLMVVSPLPDAVRDGSTSLGGYNRERMRAMVRLYHVEGTTVHSTTISLDQSDYEGLQAVAAAFGGRIPDGQTSEQVLAQRFVFTATPEEAEWLPGLVRESYDAVLTKRLGGQWFAGSRFANKSDALSYVQGHTDLGDQHMQAISRVMATVRDVSQRNRQLEGLRQRLAAAIDARLHGKTVTSLQDEAVAEQQASGDYSGDCPTPNESSAQQAEAMGMHSDSLKCVKCPLPGCGKTVDAKRTAHGGIYCPACQREARGGKIIDHKEGGGSGEQALGGQVISLLAILEEMRAEGRAKAERREAERLRRRRAYQRDKAEAARQAA
ncbi:hypothetical protein JNJ66_07680 [Candidatus Saccharibacteria bacterium]|nr:hypothetical protein [Candidatus Saccharibacteria bacterium]